jgi:hypothetical protein
MMRGEAALVEVVMVCTVVVVLVDRCRSESEAEEAGVVVRWVGIITSTEEMGEEVMVTIIMAEEEALVEEPVEEVVVIAMVAEIMGTIIGTVAEVVVADRATAATAQDQDRGQTRRGDLREVGGVREVLLKTKFEIVRIMISVN